MYPFLLPDNTIEIEKALLGISCHWIWDVSEVPPNKWICSKHQVESQKEREDLVEIAILTAQVIAEAF